MKKIIIFFMHAIIGWMLFGATVAIGRNMFSMQTTLIIHAIGAPIIFGLISWIYFTKFNFTKPLTTSALFLLFIMTMDFFVVAPH